MWKRSDYDPPRFEERRAALGTWRRLRWINPSTYWELLAELVRDQRLDREQRQHAQYQTRRGFFRNYRDY